MAINLGLDWRLATENGLTWRLATAEDHPRIVELWDAMDVKLGKQDRPNLFALPVLLTLVAVDPGGVVQGAIYGEAVVDFTGIGTNRMVVKAVDELFPTLQDFLFSRSIRTARVLVPRRVAAGMKKILPRMVDITQSFSQFVYQIRL